MFRLPDSWVWDFWFADDGRRHHLFFLFASRALHDPDARHFRASIGHAVSNDLITWERLPDALVRSDAPAFDDVATWTGSTVRDHDGTWFLFYTGGTRSQLGFVQTIGFATSPDLTTWTKHAGNPVLRADGVWYETLAAGQWHDEAFRDPWVFADPGGSGWRMLITARAADGAADDRGVVGHATSPDLRTWTLQPPLSAAEQGFGQLEVTQTEIVDGHPVMLFSCLARDTSAGRRSTGTTGGVWAATGQSLTGPWNIADAQQLTDSSRYSGRLVHARDGAWKFLAFLNDGPDGSFVGSISDPQDVAFVDGALRLADSLPAVAAAVG